jgi:hypothetical protein
MCEELKKQESSDTVEPLGDMGERPWINIYKT